MDLRYCGIFRELHQQGCAQHSCCACEKDISGSKGVLEWVLFFHDRHQAESNFRWIEETKSVWKLD
jgi:hypothetical protein